MKSISIIPTLILSILFSIPKFSTSQEKNSETAFNHSDTSRYFFAPFVEIGPPSVYLYSLNGDFSFKSKYKKKNFTSLRLGFAMLNKKEYSSAISVGRLLWLGKKSYFEFGAGGSADLNFGTEEGPQNFIMALSLIAGYRKISSRFMFKCAFTPILFFMRGIQAGTSKPIMYPPFPLFNVGVGIPFWKH